MEIIYHPERVFGYVDEEDNRVFLVEFEDGDRHVEVRMELDTARKLTEQMAKELADLK